MWHSVDFRKINAIMAFRKISKYNAGRHPPENAATQQGGVQTGKALLNAGSNTVLHDGVLAYITHVLAEGEIWH